MQIIGIVLICLSILKTGFATRREELERAAELAVERAAERVAERAVEKALESGNSTTVTETIRASHSSVRKYDSTEQLPGFITPVQRKEYERIMKEREAGELAVAQIKHGLLFKRSIGDKEISSIKKNNNHDNTNRENNIYPVRFVRQLTYQNQYQNPYQFMANNNNNDNNDNRAAMPMDQRDFIYHQNDKVSRFSPPTGHYSMEQRPMIYYVPTGIQQYPSTGSQYPVKIMEQSEEFNNRNRREWPLF